MTAAENEAVVRRVYESMSDPDALMALYAEDLVWRAPRGTSPVMGEKHGRQALADAMDFMGPKVSEFRVELIKLFADHDEVVTVHRDDGTRVDGATLDTVLCCRWVVRDGQIAELTEYSNDPSVVDEFFSA